MHNYFIEKIMLRKILGEIANQVVSLGRRRGDSGPGTGMKELAHEHRRLGRRRLHALLRREGFEVNLNRLFRIYRGERLDAPRRGSRTRAARTQAPMQAPLIPDGRWLLDSVSDHHRMLTVVGDCTRACVSPIADTSPSGGRGAREPDPLVANRGTPGMIASDSGGAFASNAILTWTDRSKVRWRYIARGNLVQNAFIESFNGRLQDDFLNETLSSALRQARSRQGKWRAGYNGSCSHSALAWRTLKTFRPHLRSGGASRCARLRAPRRIPLHPHMQRQPTTVRSNSGLENIGATSWLPIRLSPPPRTSASGTR